MAELQQTLNTLAGTTGLDAQGAANVWAGTTGKDLVSALNIKNGTVGKDLQGVLNALAGTTGKGVNGAASSLLVRNLLTANQASVETDTTGLYGYQHCSVARSTSVALDGSASLAVTTAGTVATFFIPCTGRNYSEAAAVTGGQTYTGSVYVRSAATPRGAQVAIYWWNAGGFISASYGTTVNTTTSGWQRILVTAVAPSTATRATVHVIFSSDGTVGEVHYVDCLGLWQGVGGTWALPGQIILGVNANI